MKRSRNSSVESSPKLNKKKVKNDIYATVTPSPKNNGTLTNSTRTSGGISKSLLTPCRRMGLAKSRGKPLNVFSNAEKLPCSGNADNKTTDLEKKAEKVNNTEGGEEIVAIKENNVKKSLSRRCATKSASKELVTAKEDNDKLTNKDSTTRPSVIDIFTRESKSSQDSVASSDGDSVLENIDINNVKRNIKNNKGNTNSPNVAKSKKSSTVIEKSKLIDLNDDMVSNDDHSVNQKVLPKVVLHKIKSSDTDNTWKVSAIGKDNAEISSNKDKIHVDKTESDVSTVNGDGKRIANGKSKNVESTISVGKINKGSAIQNEDKISEKASTDIHTKTKVVELKKKSLTAKESDLFQNKESKRNDRNCISLGNTPKKLNTKETTPKKVILSESVNKKDDPVKKSERNLKDTVKNKSVDKKKSDSELLKMKSKDECRNDVKKAKSAVEVVLKKAETNDVINLVSSGTSSQSSMYSYHSDDDFEDRTIVEKKTYSKKSKLQMSKSKTSINKVITQQDVDEIQSSKSKTLISKVVTQQDIDEIRMSESKTSVGKAITQKDIDEIQDRIKQKEEKLKMINESPRKGLSEAELEELIAAWRGGCQKALEELLQVSKDRGTMKTDAGMEDLLRALHIPHDLVKYDPDEMIFE